MWPATMMIAMKVTLTRVMVIIILLMMMVKWLLHPKYIAAIEKYMSFKRGRRRSYTRLEEIEILRLERLESLMPKQPSLYHL